MAKPVPPLSNANPAISLPNFPFFPSFTITLPTFKFFSFWGPFGFALFPCEGDSSLLQSCKAKVAHKTQFISLFFPFSFSNMRFLSSSPSISSSSSSSSVSFDPSMCTSKSATAGCLAGILRRILCSRSLPTHPSDHTTEANSVASYKNQKFDAVDRVDASRVTPGIVARLMGLDSLPEISLLKTQANPNSITRSRSMNSADYKQDDDLIRGKHRRVNSTLSFRDMPTYFELENEEYFVLSFEKESERKELRSRGRKCKGGSGELKQGKEEKYKEKENRVEDEEKSEGNQQEAGKRVLSVLNEEKMNRRIVEKPNNEATKCSETIDFSLEKRVVSIKGLDCSKFVDKKGVPHGAKLRKKKMKLQHRVAQDVGPECSSSEDSSPVSVLDFDQFIIDHDDIPTSGEDSKGEGSNPRRKLSPDLGNYGCKSPSNDGNLMEDDQRVKNVESKNLGSRKKDWHSEMNLECWDAICRMIETEVAKSSWLCSKNEDLEDITADFGSKILDQLLDELVFQHFGSLP